MQVAPVEDPRQLEITNSRPLGHFTSKNLPNSLDKAGNFIM